MGVLGSVAAIRRYPVKSFLGETLQEAEVGAAGITGDRGWAVFDIADGRVLSARRVPKLLEARARLEGERTLLTLDDRTLEAGDPAADQALSVWLGRPARLVRPAGQERPVIADEDGDFRGRRGTFFDAAPLHLVTTGTLRDLAARYPEGRFDPRRFRPNLVVEVEASEPVEQAWIGGRLIIGGASLVVAGPCRRCVMTTLAQEDLPADRGILRTVARETDNTVGVYALVERPGVIAVGHEISSDG